MPPEAAVAEAPAASPAPTPQTSSRPDAASAELKGITTEQFRANLDKTWSKMPDSKYAKKRAAARAQANASETPQTQVPAATPAAETEKPEVSTQEVQSQADTQASETDDPNEAKTQEAWEKYKKGYKQSRELSTKLAELQKQVEGFDQERQSFESSKGELRAIQAQLEEARKELYIHRVEATPEWNQAVNQPLNEIVDQVEFLAGRHKIDGNKIIEAIREDAMGNSGPLESLLEGQSDREKQRYYTLSENLIQIEKRKAELKKDSKAAYETSMKKQQEQLSQHQQATEKARKEAAEKINGNFTKTMKELLPEDHGIDFDAVKLDAINFDALDDDIKVFATYAANVMPAFKEAFVAMKKRAELAEGELSKIRNGVPKTTGGVSPSAPGAQEKKADYKGMTGKQFAKDSASRIRAAVGL